MSEATKDVRRAHPRAGHAGGSLLTYMCPECETLVPFYHTESLWPEYEADGDRATFKGAVDDPEDDDLSEARMAIEELDPPL
jgi:hypothetical protein